MSYKLPVSKDFEYSWENQIGTLEIFDDNFKLPEDIIFTLVGKVPPEGGIEIMGLVMQKDAVYKKYLNSKSYQYNKKFFKQAKRRKKESEKK